MTRKKLMYWLVALLAFGLAACETDEGDTATNLIEMQAGDFFIEAPDEIPSGWTTLRMENTGEQEHFIVLWPLPADKDYVDFENEVLGPFHDLVPRYDAGDLERGEFMETLGGRLPEWSFDAFGGAGGVAMTAPGRTATSTVHLEPGEYVLECYVRAPDGTLHNMMGMIAPLTVTDQANNAPEPEADRLIDVHADGIEIDEPLTTGPHVIQVNLHDHPEGLLTHDLNLARLDDDSDIDEIIAWMDWLDGMRAPAPVEFLGGVEHMPPGSTGYMHVDLEPGRYLWISEEYGAQGVLQDFEIE